MSSLEYATEVKIPSNKIFYDKKSEVLSVYILDFVFIGNYRKNTRINEILDDFHKSLPLKSISREHIEIIDFITGNRVPENLKLGKLNLISGIKHDKQVEEKAEIKEPDTKLSLSPEMEEKKKSAKKVKAAKRDYAEPVGGAILDKMGESDDAYQITYEESPKEDERKRREAPQAAPSRVAEPKAAPAPPPPGRPSVESMPYRALKEKDEEERVSEAIISEVTEEDLKEKPTVYEINMGLQYYSVMMEQTSYLFYVYFSHKELKIVDEEGKTIFETSFRIETMKKEPPILNLRVEGEDFEVHPLGGKVIVKKNAVNPPVMIFSVLPIKKATKTKKERKEGGRRYLHIYIDFEEKTINHSILSITVQPKHFRLDIGPIHLNISKKVAFIVSLLSVLIASASLVYTFFSVDPSSTFIDFVSNFAPGLGSIFFIVIFLVTLFKEGVYPLKEKISYLLNFDKTGILVK
jgi:hypothetical protein